MMKIEIITPGVAAGVPAADGTRRTVTPPSGRNPVVEPGGGRPPARERPQRPPVEHRLEHPSGPLDITPRRSGRSRALLAVLFVLLTLAAVAVAVLVLRAGSPGGLTIIPVTGTSGTVIGWEDGRTGPEGDGRQATADRYVSTVRAAR